MLRISSGPLPAVQLAQQFGVLPFYRGRAADVVRGTGDMGNYYCEHAFFALQGLAAQPGSSIQRDGVGQAMVGFLHVPDYAGSQPLRHAATAEVVGLAVAGYMRNALARSSSGPVRMLLTGYGPFAGISNNPTGDFVATQANLIAAVQRGFPGARFTGCEQQGTAQTLSFRITDSSGRPRDFQLRAQALPVADRALNVDLPQAVAQFRPQAVLSMGVAASLPPRTYTAETRADDGGLAIGIGGYRHDDSVVPRTSLTNGSLARAIADASRTSS
jgi:pyrrolidone-carboxylate peptidase